MSNVDSVDDLFMIPEMPKDSPEPALIVLGRFQPFHRGHAALVNAALENSKGMAIRIAIGSANQPESLENPWSWEERNEMIRCWLDAEHPKLEVQIVAIPDINDPPNWVQHASGYHGEPGIFFTSDAETAVLYRDAGWPTIEHQLENRESWEGWRIRSTLKMLSTVSERDAALLVMGESLPNSISEMLFDKGWLRRLAFLGRDFEVVG
tara:strand:+ start:456 stop:1079 length:624 start_codon:yes stop_codon:yes gene_type:complete